MPLFPGWAVASISAALVVVVLPPVGSATPVPAPTLTRVDTPAWTPCPVAHRTNLLAPAQVGSGDETGAAPLILQADHDLDTPRPVPGPAPTDEDR